MRKSRRKAIRTAELLGRSVEPRPFVVGLVVFVDPDDFAEVTASDDDDDDDFDGDDDEYFDEDDDEYGEDDEHDDDDDDFEGDDGVIALPDDELIDFLLSQPEELKRRDRDVIAEAALDPRTWYR